MKEFFESSDESSEGVPWPQWLGAALLVLVLGGAAWLAVPSSRVERAAAPTASLPPPSAPEQLPPVMLPRWGAALMADVGVDRAASAPSAGGRLPIEAQNTSPSSDMEVCGWGQADTRTDAGKALMAQVDEASQVAFQAHLLRMQQSTDVHTRAAGWMGADKAEPLVSMALQSSDPTIYAMAMQACSGKQRAQVCQLLSPEQAARLDPDNAVVWLDVLAAAMERGESGNAAAAMHRASLAGSSRLRAAGFAALAFAAVPAHLPAKERVPLTIAIILRQAAMPIPAYQNASRYCSTEAVKDANVLQTCAALADVLGKGASMVDVGIGARIGERVGWPSERVELVKARQHISTELMPGGNERNLHRLFSCEGVRELEDWWRQASKNGEVRAHTELIARRGWSDAQVLLLYRQHRQRIAAAQISQSASAVAAP